MLVLVFLLLEKCRKNSLILLVMAINNLCVALLILILVSHEPRDNDVFLTKYIWQAICVLL